MQAIARSELSDCDAALDELAAINSAMEKAPPDWPINWRL